ncbi:MAG: hypothetical protein ACYCQJ_02570 [Nitrososphaerales archaeon]
MKTEERILGKVMRNLENARKSLKDPDWNDFDAALAHVDLSCDIIESILLCISLRDILADKREKQEKLRQEPTFQK